MPARSQWKFTCQKRKVLTPRCGSARGHTGFLFRSGFYAQARVHGRSVSTAPDPELVERVVHAKVVALKPKGGRNCLGIEFTSVPAETNMKIQLFVQLLIFTDLT